MNSAILFDSTVGSLSNIYSTFPEACFLVPPMESLLLEEEVLWRQTRITTEKAITFDPIVGSRSNIYSSF